MPGTGSPAAVVPSTRARPLREPTRPPLRFSTAAMTATMPPSMIRPWMKSLMAVAM